MQELIDRAQRAFPSREELRRQLTIEVTLGMPFNPKDVETVLLADSEQRSGDEGPLRSSLAADHPVSAAAAPRGQPALRGGGWAAGATVPGGDHHQGGGGAGGDDPGQNGGADTPAS